MGGKGRMGFLVASALTVGGAYRLLPPPTASARHDIHAEYIKYPSGADSITAYLAYPERADRAPAIVVIHEIFGMSDFVRSTTEQLAKDGFVALAPDLLTRRGGTPASPDSARKLIATLNPDTITRDLDAGVAYLKTLKSARPDRIGVIGFCWGGGQSFRYATNNPSLSAFVVCYGPAPDLADISRIKTPGFGAYAENDARIDQGLPEVREAARRAAVSYRTTIYPGVGPGFLRAREKPAVADQAWGDILAFFRDHLK